MFRVSHENQKYFDIRLIRIVSVNVIIYCTPIRLIRRKPNFFKIIDIRMKAAYGFRFARGIMLDPFTHPRIVINLDFTYFETLKQLNCQIRYICIGM